MDLGADPGFQGIGFRLSDGDQGLLLVHIQLAGQAGIGAGTDDGKELALARQLAPGDGLASLQRAQGQVVASRLGGEGDLKVAAAPLGGFAADAGGVLALAGAAEEVELPRGVQASAEGVELAAGQSEGRRRVARPAALARRDGDGVLADPVAGGRAVELDRGQPAGAGDDLLLTGLLDAGGGLLQIEIALERAGHEVVQNRILELGPPSREIGLSRAGLGFGEYRWRLRWQIGRRRVQVGAADEARRQAGGQQHGPGGHGWSSGWVSIPPSTVRACCSARRAISIGSAPTGTNTSRHRKPTTKGPTSDTA